MANTTINIFGSNGEAMVGADTINTILASMDSKLTSDDINIETLGDGTVDVDVKNDTYTINLNHTHEGMAKLVKCTEATLPQTMADDTIYVQVDNLTTPTEIEALHIFGLEFTGGGLPAGTPAITKPSGTTLNLGNNEGSGVSKAIEIKANSHITGDLTVGLAANSNLSFDTTNLPSGVTYNSGAGTLTIAQATAMQGVNITIVYSGSGAAEIDGGLVISGGGATPKSVVVVVVQPLAFWDGADLPSNNKWIDKINNLPINLFGTASHATNGYQLNNLSDQDAAWALSDAANNAFLNQEIDKEFRAIVECSIKFGATDRRALVLDFGSFGGPSASTGLALNAFVKQTGIVSTSFKQNGNSLGTQTMQTDIVFPVGTYVDVTLEIGVRILQNGKQELYVSNGNSIISQIIDTPVAVSFAGTAENSGAFALGVGYFAGDNNTLHAYASNVFADVIYKSIKIYKG